MERVAAQGHSTCVAGLWHGPRVPTAGLQGRSEELDEARFVRGRDGFKPRYVAGHHEPDEERPDQILSQLGVVAANASTK